MSTEPSLIDRTERLALIGEAPVARPAGAGRPGLFLVLAWVVAIGLIAAGALAGYWAAFRQDQYQLILLGDCLYRGGRLYLDCWENKPPGIAWLCTLGIALARGDQIGAWVMPAQAGVLCLGIMFLAMRRYLGNATAGVMLVVGAGVYTLRPFDACCIHPDFYSSLFELAAFSLGLTAATSRSRLPAFWLALLAGVALAAAATVKQTALFTAVVLSAGGIALWWAAPRELRASRWVGVGAALGLLGGVALVVWELEREGVLASAAWAVFGFNRQYAGGVAGALTYSALSWENLRALQPVLWLAAIGLVASFVSARHRLLMVVLAAWWVGHALLARTGPSSSMRYWQATFPPMLWMAAWGVRELGRIWLDVDRRHRAGLLMLGLTAVVLVSEPFVDAWKLGVAQSVVNADDPDSERERLRAAGSQAASLLPEDEAMYVWSYDPGMYLYADRRPASRFTYPRDREQMTEILRELRAGAARLILVPRGPVPVFDACAGGDWRGELERVLAGWSPAGAVGRYEAWVPAGSPRTHPASEPATSPPS